MKIVILVSVLWQLRLLGCNGNLRVLENEANKFYDRNHPLYDAALLTRVILNMLFVQLSILKQTTKRHFIKVPFINKGIEFIYLYSLLKDRSVTSSILSYFKISDSLIICYKYNKPI